MRVLHVIPSLSPTQGGPSLALPAMARALSAEGVKVDVICTDDDGKGRHVKDIQLGQWTQREGYRVTYFPKQVEFYKVSLPLAKWLRLHARDYDLVHIHALFSFSSIAAARAARKAGVPYIVRPLGVLNQWGMSQRRRWIKGLSYRLFDGPALNHASAIHYTSQAEAADAARLGLRSRASIIPLGIELSDFEKLPDASSFRQKYSLSEALPVVLYLSRLDPKKNVELLLNATAQLDQPVQLVIAGSGDEAYVEKLQSMARELGLSVTWVGHVSGELKLSALAAATVYVLPSHTENFGIALLEAMAAGCACVATTGVALAAESAECGAVRVVAPEVSSLTEALKQLLNAPSERAELGRAARTRAQEAYSVKAMGRSLHDLYQSLIPHAA